MLHSKAQLPIRSCIREDTILAPQIAGLERALGLGRPNATPAVRINEFARENLARSPYVTIRPLDQHAVRAILFGSRIGA